MARRRGGPGVVGRWTRCPLTGRASAKRRASDRMEMLHEGQQNCTINLRVSVLEAMLGLGREAAALGAVGVLELFSDRDRP